MKDDNEFLQYFRYFRDEDVSTDFAWWYCLADGRVYETLDVFNNFGYSTKEEIHASNSFVEFDRVDVIELKRIFLLQEIGLREYKAWEFIPDNEFDRKFNIYIDINHLMREWYEFEKLSLHSAFIRWQSTNGILLKC